MKFSMEKSVFNSHFFTFLLSIVDFVGDAEG